MSSPLYPFPLLAKDDRFAFVYCGIYPLQMKKRHFHQYVNGRSDVFANRLYLLRYYTNESSFCQTFYNRYDSFLLYFGSVVLGDDIVWHDHTVKVMQ